MYQVTVSKVLKTFCFIEIKIPISTLNRLTFIFFHASMTTEFTGFNPKLDTYNKLNIVTFCSI